MGSTGDARQNPNEQRSQTDMSHQYQPCESRFRSSKYFQDDQLRFSEAADDLRSIKNLINSARAFQGKMAFQFQAIKSR